jgi:uncharacterized repeat protein (TIGR04076 family)
MKCCLANKKEGENMAVSEEMLEGLKQQLGYSDEQMEMWKSNPKNLKIAEVFPECQTYQIVAEVIKSHGCGAGHNVGDKFIFSGDGCFVTKEPPGKVCLAGLQPLIGRLDTLVLDSLLDGKEPRGLVWDAVHCVDVGVENGGWGEIIMKVKVEKI